jgi:hypothetical protein
MANPKLLLVVGSGASIDFGLPSVPAVSGIIATWAQDWYPLASNRNTNVYADLEQRIREHLRRTPNFEDILYAIFAFAAAYTAAPGALVQPQQLPDFLFGGREHKRLDQYQLGYFGNCAIDALLSEFRQRCRTAQRDRTGEFNRLQSFVAALRTKFDVAVVTLNYDNIIYRAFSGIETGFDPDSGLFQPQRIFGRKEHASSTRIGPFRHADRGRTAA